MLSQLDSQCWVNWIFNIESIWLSMVSQFDSQCWVNLTLNVESIGLSMLSQLDFQCWVNMTLNVESIWLSMLSQFDFQCCQFDFQWLVNLTFNVEPIWLFWLSTLVNLTQIFSSYPLCRVEFYFRQWLNFLCQNDLIFFSLCIRACRHNYSELDDATPQSIKISALVYRW